MNTKIHRSKNGKIRNCILGQLAESDPTRFRASTIKSEKDKRRPRNSNRRNRSQGDD